MENNKKVPLFEDMQEKKLVHAADLDFTNCRGYSSFAKEVKECYPKPRDLSQWLATVCYPWPEYCVDYLSNSRMALDPIEMSWSQFKEEVFYVIMKSKNESDKDMVVVDVFDANHGKTSSQILRSHVTTRKRFKMLLTIMYNAGVGEEPHRKAINYIAHMSCIRYFNMRGYRLRLPIAAEEEGFDKHNDFHVWHKEMMAFFPDGEEEEGIDDDESAEEDDEGAAEEDNEGAAEEDEVYYDFGFDSFIKNLGLIELRL